MGLPSRAYPIEVEDVGDKDLLQNIDLARILVSEAKRLRREARPASIGQGKPSLTPSLVALDCIKNIHKELVPKK
jgi:hypothetical protein